MRLLLLKIFPKPYSLELFSVSLWGSFQDYFMVYFFKNQNTYCFRICKLHPSHLDGWGLEYWFKETANKLNKYLLAFKKLNEYILDPNCLVSYSNFSVYYLTWKTDIASLSSPRYKMAIIKYLPQGLKGTFIQLIYCCRCCCCYCYYSVCLALCKFIWKKHKEYVTYNLWP